MNISRRINELPELSQCPPAPKERSNHLVKYTPVPTHPENPNFGCREVRATERPVGLGKQPRWGLGKAFGPPTGYEGILTPYTPLGRTGVAACSDWCVAAGGLGGMPYLYLAIRRKRNIVRR